MIDQERAITLLGAGMGPTDVGTALGCDPSFISQLLMDDAVRAKVLALRIQNLQAQTQRDRQIDGIEDDLIVKLKENVQWITKPRDILAAFQILNSAKRRGAITAGAINITQNVVSINMPPAARQHFFPTLNAHGEVVQVGDQVTVTKGLQQLMRERLQERKLTAEDAQIQEKDVLNGTRRESATSSAEKDSGRQKATA